MIRPFSALLLPSETLPPLEYHLINTYTYTHTYMMSLHVFFCLPIYLPSGPEAAARQEVCFLDAENLDGVFTVNPLIYNC